MADFTKESRVKLSNGKSMPQVFFGTYLVQETTTEEVVKNALEVGYRGVDTAEWYENEEGAGHAISAFTSVPDAHVKRSDIFFTTKLRDNVSYEATASAIDKSLRLSGLEYIDLYLLHSPIGGPEIRRECYRAVVDAVKAGKIISPGVSNFGIKHLEELYENFPEYPPVVNQIELNPFNTQDKLVEFCKNKGIVLQAYGPTTANLRLNHPAVTKVAGRVGRTNAQVLLKWSLQQGYVPLPKTVRRERMVENLDGIIGWGLGEEDLKDLAGLDEHLVNEWDPTVEP